MIWMWIKNIACQQFVESLHINMMIKCKHIIAITVNSSTPEQQFPAAHLLQRTSHLVARRTTTFTTSTTSVAISDTAHTYYDNQ